ncbi:MAG: hypothetical protein IJL25_09565 [Clostridia bacterium]|nr:hypothetical protein [Clostridia bacterium]
MSKPKRNVKKIVPVVLAIIILLGACFTFVGVYAKHELNKPKFTLPDATLASKSELPKSKAETVAYVKELYNAAVQADDVEGSWHTDAKLKDYDEGITASLSDADREIIAYIWEHADENDRVKNLYPKESGVLKCGGKGVYRFDVTDAQVLDYTAERGRYNDDNVYIDDDYYFITLNVDPATVDAAAIPQGDTYHGFEEIFAPAFTVESPAFEVKSVTMKFKIARTFDEIVSLEITRDYKIKAQLHLTDAYAGLLASPVEAVELPYQSTEKVSFKYYGAHFTKACIAVNPGDMEALPAAVRVNDASTKAEQSPPGENEFYLSFVPSDPEVLKIDGDGVMSVNGASDQPVTVTMTLEYGGHTYTDELTVYITELEVATDNG